MFCGSLFWAKAWQPEVEIVEVPVGQNPNIRGDFSRNLAASAVAKFGSYTGPSGVHGDAGFPTAPPNT